MKFIVCKNYDEVSRRAGEMFAEQIRSNPRSVLGLATGSTPLGLYAYLAEQCKAGLDFSALTTVNLDEYYPIAPDHSQSYRYFMNENLFRHVNIDLARTFVPNGLTEDPAAEGAAYDARIRELGGIDLQLLGIGQNGHIAFNEPEDALVVGTHATDLTESTIRANSRFFASEDEVPRRAITMGMGSILSARRIVMLVCGKNKHEALVALQNDRITTACPATLLKLHPDVTVFCDEEAVEG